MRVAVFLVWVLAFVAMLAPFFRRGAVGGSARAPRALRDELVKDPVCQTYVVRSRAVSRGDVAFCSADCAARYAAR
ncbi:MAG TPA: hypothetical protein VMR23_04630 [Candidatus Limnocylindria bacterium]|jgi:hypothetical protein|nr:hypothetical protein [Candidatus Limnocylindria bacterium]